MREEYTTNESQGEGNLLAQIAYALHEICQPLTVLQCRLEMDLMESDLGPSVKQIAGDCLRECDRLNARVHTMHQLVRRAKLDEQRGRG